MTFFSCCTMNIIIIIIYFVPLTFIVVKCTSFISLYIFSYCSTLNIDESETRTRIKICRKKSFCHPFEIIIKIHSGLRRQKNIGPLRTDTKIKKLFCHFSSNSWKSFHPETDLLPHLVIRSERI